MFKLVGNEHPTFAWICQPIDDQQVIDTPMDYFDKDGYELNKLEQLYYAHNDVDISEKHLYHTANHVWWFKQTEEPKYGPRLDHSLINTRWAYGGWARTQIEKHSKDNPLLNKLLDMKPKWGLDFSLDWVDNEICFELFHIELDRFDRDELVEYKERAEEIILGTDWVDAGEAVKAKRDQWQNLSSDDQSDWKAQYFGWHRAFDNRKVYAGGSS